ncbi:MAG: hypothetical protein ACI943_000970, partial [Gammaproteobacteria bacterium]
MEVDRSFYLSKYGDGTPRISRSMRPGTEIIVTIPCHNEPSLDESLMSLLANDDPGCLVEIIVVINADEAAEERILAQNNSSKLVCLRVRKELPSWLELHVLEENKLPVKHAGVGLARKIAMDEASWRFENVIEENGIIVCYDADSLCETNYLREIKIHFDDNKRSPGCSIRYEHPLKGSEYSQPLYSGIAQYELHLRYYTMQQKWLNLPFAYQTIGSSMAVRWKPYQLEGGMNKRKAGEDFYFLQKIIARGDFSELSSTRVIPSPRSSDRVPFGTGKAVQDYLDRNGEELTTYNPLSFEDLKVFLKYTLFEQMNEDLLPDSIKAYLSTTNWEEANREIRANSSTQKAFVKRFYRWFNAFRLMKYLHYSRD